MGHSTGEQQPKSGHDDSANNANRQNCSRMGSRNKVEGRIYSFRSGKECTDLGLPFPDIPSIVTCHMVLALDWVPQRQGFVKVMTVGTLAGSLEAFC